VDKQAAADRGTRHDDAAAEETWRRLGGRNRLLERTNEYVTPDFGSFHVQRECAGIVDSCPGEIRAAAKPSPAIAANEEVWSLSESIDAFWNTTERRRDAGGDRQVVQRGYFDDLAPLIDWTHQRPRPACCAAITRKSDPAAIDAKEEAANYDGLSAMERNWVGWFADSGFQAP
jgi:hypothetical protein